jgi:FkbM family methyltransferase
MLRNLFRSVVSAAATVTPDPVAYLFPPMGLVRASRVRNEAVIRRLCHSVPVGDDIALCRVLGRYKMYVDSREIGIAPHLMLDGYWEMWVTEVLVSLVRSGMVVADIGANLGYFSIILADLVGPGGHVHAFEPNPHMIDLLQRSLSVNGFTQRVTVHQLALGAENEGQVALIVPPNDPKNAHVVPMSDELHVGAVPVPVARLDGRPDWAKIEFAKVDVEGAEQLIWAGAQGLLDGSALRTVILEFTAARYHDPAGFLAALTAPGFRLAYIDLRRGILDITVDQILERDPYVDIMLVLRR